MLLMVGSYLLRPTLASLGLARKIVDERQMSIHYRSGNLAFTVMIMTCIVITIYYASKDDHTWEMFNMVVIIGIAAKALFNVLLVKNYREGASRIIITVGFLIALFCSFEIFDNFKWGNLLIVVPGLAIAGVGWLGRKYPRPVGVVVFIITAVMLYVILWRRITWGQIMTALVIGVPMILAGLSLFIRENADTETTIVQSHNL